MRATGTGSARKGTRPYEIDVEIDETKHEEKHPAESVVDYWRSRRPTEPYLELLEFLASWHRMEALDSFVPRNVLANLPRDPPDREEISQIRQSAGFMAVGCPDAGDGAKHDQPRWRPYLTGNRWDPHARSWDAYQTRGSTMLERFKQMANSFDEFGLIRIELTLPKRLHPDAWGEIIDPDDGGGSFAKLGHRFILHAWDLMELPGEPVGCSVAIHRSSSSFPNIVRPHLHVWAPAIYRDAHGHLHPLEREPGTQKPLFRPKRELDAMRLLWRCLLEDHFDTTLEEPQNLRFRPLWVRDGKDRAQIQHGAKYISRPHLEDVNRRVLEATEALVHLDVKDREDLDRDVAAIPTKPFLAGMLAIQALTPKGWQQNRYYGEMSHRKWGDLARELELPSLEPPENLWGQLVEIGGAWAAGHQDRNRMEVLHYLRGEIDDHIMFLVMNRPNAPEPPLPPDIRAAAIRTLEAAEYVTQPLANQCVRCGAILESLGHMDGDALIDVIRAHEPDPAETDETGRRPQDKPPNVSRAELIHQADVDEIEREHDEDRHQYERRRLLHEPNPYDTAPDDAPEPPETNLTPTQDGHLYHPGPPAHELELKAASRTHLAAIKTWLEEVLERHDDHVAPYEAALDRVEAELETRSHIYQQGFNPEPTPQAD